MGQGLHEQVLTGHSEGSDSTGTCFRVSLGQLEALLQMLAPPLRRHQQQPANSPSRPETQILSWQAVVVDAQAATEWTVVIG